MGNADVLFVGAYAFFCLFGFFVFLFLFLFLFFARQSAWLGCLLFGDMADYFGRPRPANIDEPLFTYDCQLNLVFPIIVLYSIFFTVLAITLPSIYYLPRNQVTFSDTCMVGFSKNCVTCVLYDVEYNVSTTGTCYPPF